MKKTKWVITILGFIFFITFAIIFANCGDSSSNDNNEQSSTGGNNTEQPNTGGNNTGGNTGLTEIFTLTVSKSDIHIISHSNHAVTTVPAGTYTISWKSGGICGGASCSSPEDYSPIFVYVDDDSNKQFFYLLQDPGDSIQVTQSRDGEIYAWYMDINTFDNKGQATLSISGQQDLIVSFSNCEVYSESEGVKHDLPEGHYKIQWKEGGIYGSSSSTKPIPLVVFISEDNLKNLFYLLPSPNSSFEVDQKSNPNGRILAWYMDINSFDNYGDATIAILK